MISPFTRKNDAFLVIIVKSDKVMTFYDLL